MLVLNILNNLIFSTTINFSIVIICSIFGYGFLKRVLINNNFNNSLLLFGSSYFVGIALFLILWRLIDILLLGNAFLSLVSSLLFLFSIIFYFYNKDIILFYKFIKDNFLKLFISIIFISILVFLYWVQITEPLFYFTRIGSLHTGDYALVSEYINKYNEIPTIRRNMAQMMLGSISMMFGYGNAIFPLYFYLCFSILFMSIFILGLISYFKLLSDKTIYYFLIFAFGSFALSLTRVIIIDAGNPIFTYGYTDTLLANWFALFSIFLIYIYSRDNKKLNLYENLVIFFIFSTNCLYGSHNLVLLAPLLFFSFIFKLLTLRQFLNFFIILFFALLISLTFGGLLTLELFSTETGLGSLDSTHSLTQRIEMTSHPIITYVPTLVHYGLGKNGEWISNPFLFTMHSMQNLGILLPDEFTLKKTVYFILHFINANEILFFNSLRLIFWPLFGYIAFLIVLKKIYLQNQTSIYKFIYVGSFSLFISAYLIAFFLAYYGMKWELSRFMMGGMQFGMLMLILVFNYLNNISKFFNKYIFPFLVIVIISGPVVHVFLRTYENLIKFLIQDGFFKKAVFLLLTHNYLN